MENGRSYFFRDLIVKILLVLLFVFLLMWLFPMPDLNPLYDKIFSQNINSMTDAAKSYFTVSRLPQKEGETKKLTLGDMIDNKMIIEFTDSDGKTCDKDMSYVEVTKKGDEYIYKTNLVCSNQSDYVIEYFGCYDVCADGKCEVEVIEKPSTDTKKVTEYQFYKEVSTNYIDKYICKEGYTLEGTKCVLNSEVKKQEEASMKCLSGYSYNSETKKCEAIKVEKVNATLSCPSGYVYSSDMNKCIKGSSNTVDATIAYTCNEGTLVGNKCVITKINKVDAQKVYSCKEGKLNGTKCIINSSYEVGAEKVYTCEKGTLSGTKCIITNSSTVEAQKVYSCKEGKLNGSKCIISTTSETNAKLSYSCSNGTLSGTKCVIQEAQTCDYSNWVCSNKTYSSSVSSSSSSTFTRKFLYQTGTSRVYEECSRTYSCDGGGSSTVDATAKYTCDEGTLSGTKCIVNSTKTEDASVTYKCSEGTLNGSECILSKSNEVDAKLSYKCTNGTLNGSNCIVTTETSTNADLAYKCTIGTLVDKNMCEISVNDEVSANKKYVCQAGKLNGTKCEISNVSTVDTVYTCEYGTLSGKSCLITSTDIKEPIYYCRSGYTLANKNCYITESSKDVQDAKAVYKTKTEKVYKWSRSETLDGWIRTGKTRTSDISITSRY